MTKTLVHTVVGINNCTLIVFYTDARCWQFRIIYDGGIYGEKTIYYFASGAMDAGREWIVGM
ncbi:MAG: hypothetical protein AAF383_12885 [Cyanobacteria bacterium P01_A01_bin.83]